MDESEEQVQVALGTMMSTEDINRTIALAFVHDGYANHLTQEEILADMLSYYESEDEEDTARFLRQNEARVLEVSREMRGVLFEHFHNKWRQ